MLSALSTTLSVYGTLIALYAAVFYDCAVDTQNKISVLLTRSQCRISATQVSVKTRESLVETML